MCFDFTLLLNINKMFCFLSRQGSVWETPSYLFCNHYQDSRAAVQMGGLQLAVGFALVHYMASAHV